MKTIFTASFTLLCLAATLAPTASATPGPIAVTACEVQKTSTVFGGVLVFNGKTQNSFKIGFTNTSSVAADRVVLQIDFEKSQYVFPASGTFSPGVSVTRAYPDHGSGVVASARPGGYASSTVCAVRSAHFTNGTTWSAPSP
jgi:hypothetical protein